MLMCEDRVVMIRYIYKESYIIEKSCTNLRCKLHSLRNGRAHFCRIVLWEARTLHQAHTSRFADRLLLESKLEPLSHPCDAIAV